MGNRRLLAAGVLAAFAVAPAVAAAPASADTGAKRYTCTIIVYTTGHSVKAKCPRGGAGTRFRVVANFCTEHGCRWIAGNWAKYGSWSRVHSSGYYSGHVKLRHN
jgi:hypothetical protein